MTLLSTKYPLQGLLSALQCDLILPHLLLLQLLHFLAFVEPHLRLPKQGKFGIIIQQGKME